MCKKAIDDNPESFYSQGFINYRGRTTDNILCSEIIAEFLLIEENFKRISSIECKSRHKVGKHYNMNHQGKYPKNANHDNEKIIAIDLFNQSKECGKFDFIGEIIDYQTPLKQKMKDPYGEIDLLSANENDIYLLELKKNNAKKHETMLRCVLEAFTYYKIADWGNLLKEFGKEEYNIKISPLVFQGDTQYKEWVDMNDGNRPKLKELMQRLGIVPYFLCPSNAKYTYKVMNE